MIAVNFSVETGEGDGTVWYTNSNGELVGLNPQTGSTESLDSMVRDEVGQHTVGSVKGPVVLAGGVLLFRW